MILQMTNFKLAFLYLFTLLLMPSLGISQQREARFEHLTIEDGLSQNSVNCILQDRQGFMWFGTQDGLSRYDGYHFDVFKNKLNDSTSLPPNRHWIETLALGSNGDIWVGTY